jgi:hypothetical protein
MVSEGAVFAFRRSMLVSAHPGSLIHGEAFAASRLSIMRIMARRKNAVTVVA